jgi:ligand-binding sensor domain-containing protein
VRYSPGSSHPWRLFDAEDGLALGDRPILAQSTDGTIWSVSAQALIGVNRFDGERWSHQSLGSLTGGSNIHCSLLATKDGTVWVGGYGGMLFRYQNGEWISHRPPNHPLSRTRVSGMLETSEGALWIASLGQEASRLDYMTSRWSSYKVLGYQCEAADGSIWFLRGQQVVRYLPETASDAGKWTLYDKSDGLMDTPFLIRATREGSVWISGTHNGVAAAAQFEDEKWQLHLHPDISQGFDRRSLFVASDSSVWFAAAVSRDPELGQLGGMALPVECLEVLVTLVNQKTVQRISNATGLDYTLIPIIRDAGVLGFIQVESEGGLSLAQEQTLASFALQAAVAISDANVQQDVDKLNKQLDDALELDEILAYVDPLDDSEA